MILSHHITMAKQKLILICQSGGDFKTNDDGSMSYTGGEAHAVEINHETLFSDLKFKFAELWNLEYKTLSIKYFLPGNCRTLISVSNDKDLKRLYDFHNDSVVGYVFISGKEGLDRETVGIWIGNSNIKVAELVTPKVASANKTTKQTVSTQCKVGATAELGVMQANYFDSDCTLPDSAMAVTTTILSSSDVDIASNLFPVHTVYDDRFVPRVTGTGSAAITDDTGHQIFVDVDSSPAATVKKRRRTASWTFGSKDPTIVSSNKNRDKRKETSRKKNVVNHFNASDDDSMEDEEYVVTDNDSDSSFVIAGFNDMSPEKLVESWKDGITGVGQDFKSVKEFRDSLQKYAIAHRFAYRLIKNDTSRASGRCVVEGCPWRIHASWVPSEHSFRIKKMDATHTCEGESRKSAQPAKNWLVNVIKERLRDSPNHKPKDIAKGILQDFGVELNYTQVWRGIGNAKKQLQVSHADAYNHLPEFCEKMVEANPGSLVKLFTHDDKTFHRLFISFHAVINGFQAGCLPLLFLDATYMRSKYHEIMLTATAIDGDDGALPVAFAIVDDENDDNWHWFLELLRDTVVMSQPITFVCDRDKGLKEAVSQVFENANYGYSMYHLLESMKRKLKGQFLGGGKGSVPSCLVAAAHAVLLDRFKMHIEQTKRISAEAYDWIMQIEPEHWANAAFKGERYNHILVNFTEFYITWLEEVRELTMIQKLGALASKIMELVNNRRVDSCNWSTQLTPTKEAKLREEALKARSLQVLFSSDTVFEVRGDANHVVNIEKLDCSCHGWKGTGIPCSHAIAVFNCTKLVVYDHCSRYFTVDNFRRTYAESINTASMSSKPSQTGTGDVLPPSISKELHQSKKTQYKTEGINKKSVTCTRCKEVGHNKKTCKANL